MTVVSVIGLINSHEIICTHVGVDQWDCDPGETPDGRYVAEFWATDEAGNIGYRAAVLYIYDGRCVKLEWIDDGIEVKFICENFDMAFIEDTFDISLFNIQSVIDIDYEPDRFTISIVKCVGVN